MGSFTGRPGCEGEPLQPLKKGANICPEQGQGSLYPENSMGLWPKPEETSSIDTR